MINWKWYKSELPTKNGLKAMSCFSCGGGSSYGYKLAGFDVIANCEIDEKINKMYLKNHHPKYNYFMDIRDFAKMDNLPKELYDLDVLDGSPPCSTFSMAGDREKGWGKEKQFREGQKKQRLDDLFFAFLDVVEKLKPKAVVAENVEGLLAGNAKGYVTEIVSRFNELGYKVQLFKLNSKTMGVPQSRTRVFFVANRMGFGDLRIFNGQSPIVFGKVKSEHGGNDITEHEKMLLSMAKRTDKTIADINLRIRHKNSGFTMPIVYDDMVCPTVTSGGKLFRKDKDGWDGFSAQDFTSVQTFPQDYDYDGNDPHYVCGMSVPPLMMHKIADAIAKQWFKVGE